MEGPAVIDPRGPRFAAALTTLVLAIVLVTGSRWLLAAQVVVFALGAAGVSPYAAVFKRFVRPRLAPPAELEDPRPPRFAQGIGLVFALVGLVGFIAGPTWLGYLATGFALVAALLNATIQVCLGCQIYGVCHLPEQKFEVSTSSTSSTHPNPEKKEALV